MPLPCFALLDDNDASAAAPRSRLYTGYHATLICSKGKDFPALLDSIQTALQQGLHAVTLFSYELGAELQGIVQRHSSHAGKDGAYGEDGEDDQSCTAIAEILLFAQCQRLSADETWAWLQQQAALENEETAGVANLRASVDEAQFSTDIARIRDYIAAGDTYQVNYTYRLHFDVYGAPIALYNKLRARQPVPYGAFIRLPDARCILSFSPELFVRHENGRLHAQPMKGTARAATDQQENARRAQALSNDEKNRAENLMIVDLLRNDLGRIAVNGSVAVPYLFAVQRFGQVLQMTSTVTAQLRPDAGLNDIFNALYPCGSITGAPKRRTMQIIDELESTPRGLYTGAIGWFDAASEADTDVNTVGDFCLSVPIRTLSLQAPRDGVCSGEMGVGAGIVYDSNAADEYVECQLKASFLTGLGSDFSLFETIYATREEGCRHLDLHLQRLYRSASYFNFDFDDAALRDALNTVCAQLPSTTPHRLRLDLHPDGKSIVQPGVLSILSEPVKVFISPHIVDSKELFLRHKSSIRTVYDKAWKAAEQRGGFDMLFFNEQGELAEGGRSNVFVQIDGHWYTPPLAAGALPGVMRSVLLKDVAWAAAERTITRKDLLNAQSVMLCNALRGAIAAEVIS